MSEYEGKFRDERLRGEHARRLLEDGLLQEAFAKVDASIIGKWRNEETIGPENRERLWMMLGLLARVKAHIAEVAKTGELAAQSLAEIEARKESGNERR